MAAERNQTQADVSTSSQVLTARAPHAPDTPVVDTIYAPAESIELVELPYKQNASTAAAPVEEGTSPASVSEDAVREQHRKVNIHFCTMCFSMFLLGWNDGSTGPLLPRIQEVYHVRAREVSVICTWDRADSDVMTGKLYNSIIAFYLQLLRKWCRQLLCVPTDQQKHRASSLGHLGTLPLQNALASAG